MRLAPQHVIGNIRLTPDGPYADYLLSGLPFIFLSKEWQDMVAAEHAELWRNLPSGSSVSGLTVPIPTDNIVRRMLYAHEDIRDNGALTERTAQWVDYCDLWRPTITASQPRRRIYWLSVPLGYGLEGMTGGGAMQQWRDLVVGRDFEAAIGTHQELAAQIISRVPAAFFPKPASAEQVWWQWNYTASRGAWQQPLPTTPHDPHASLPGSAFTPVHFDQSAAELRGRRWRAARKNVDNDVFLRTYRDADDGIPDSYQAYIPLQKFPGSGIRWPKSTLFKLLDDLTQPGIVLDWTINVRCVTVDAAVSASQDVARNIRDQRNQRGPYAMTDDELIRQMASNKELTSEYKRGTAERGVKPSIVMVAAATTPEAMNNAIDKVIRQYRKQEIGSKRWPGSQPTLWRAFNPGTEAFAKLKNFRNPTTTARFGKFVPLLAARLGNNTGIPLGETLTSTGLREVVLLDLLFAPARDNPMNLVISGSPGRGKSQLAKNINKGCLRLGAGLHIFDPTPQREHQRALEDFDDKTIIDLARATSSLDGLRIFPFEEAAEKTIDHLLPQLGFGALSAEANRLKALLTPQNRDREGIKTTNRFIEYLRDRRRDDYRPIDDSLCDALEALRCDALLRPLFDESLDPPDLTKQCVVWNLAGLPELPTAAEEHTAHLHHLTTPGQRAAVALYGLAADVATTLFFSRPDQPDILSVDEATPWTNSPGGKKTANRVITQGRKAWTGLVGVGQHPVLTWGVLQDEFIEQRILMGFRNAELCRVALEWCERDLERHPELLDNYVNKTSPVQMVDHGDDAIDPRHGRVVPGREGEAWFLDEFRGFGKFKAYEAPTRELAASYDTNPHRVKQQRRQAQE